MNGQPQNNENLKGTETKIEEMLKPPKPEAPLSSEGLDSLGAKTQEQIKKSGEQAIQDGRKKMIDMVDRLDPTASFKAEEMLKPVATKMNILSDEAQKAISDKLKAEGLAAPEEPLPLEVPIVDFNKLPDEAKPAETVKAQPEKSEFDESKLRQGLKATGALNDEMVEMIVNQERAKAMETKGQETKTEAAAEAPKTRAEEVKAHNEEVKANIAANMAQAKRMMEENKAQRDLDKAEAPAETPQAEVKADEIPVKEELPVKKDKIDRVDDKELQEAQTLLSEGMDMKKNLDAWNEVIDSQMAQVRTKPEKQSRINKFFDKVRGLVTKTESLVNKILQRNKLTKIEKLLTPEGRKNVMEAVKEKIEAKIGNTAELKPEIVKAPKFDEKKLRSYLKDQGVPPEITDEIISQEKSEAKKLEKKGRIPKYTKEVKRRLGKLENEIKNKAKSVKGQMEEMKDDFVNFKNEMAGALNKAGSEWKKMNVMESIASKFKGYLNRGQAFLVTEAERVAIRNQQKKLEKEQQQMKAMVEKQVLERQRREAAAEQAARKKEEMAQREKARQEKAWEDAAKKADKDLAKAQKELAAAQAKVQKAEANKARIAAAELARKTKSEEIAAKEAAKKQTVSEVKAKNEEVAQDFKARAEAAREMTQAEGERKRQEAAQVNQPQPESMPAQAATGEQLYGREAMDYEELAKQQAAEQAKEEPPVRINVNQPPAQSPDQFKKAA